MKLWKKIFICAVALLIVLFVIASALVALYGKKLAESQIEKNLGMKASIGNISLRLPLALTLRKLEIGNLFKAEKISFSPNLLGALAGKVVLDGLSIIDPVVNIEQLPDGKLSFTLPKQQGKAPEVYLTGFRVVNGQVNFTDKKISQQGFRVTLEGVNVDISKVMFPPTSLNAKFNIGARITGEKSKKLGSIAFSGWLDFGPKDMDGVLELKDIDVVYFAPYYGDFVSSRKILTGTLNIVSSLKAKNDNLVVLTNLRLSGLTFAQEEQLTEGELPKLDLTKNALDLFTDKQGDLALEFSVNTKLTNPNVTIGELKKAVLSAAAKNLANQNPQDLIEKVFDTVKQFESFGQEMKGIFGGKKAEEQPVTNSTVGPALNSTY